MSGERKAVEGSNSRTYTVHNNEYVNAAIESRLQLVTNIILANTAGVTSILLTGGFGKGEGSIQLTPDGKVRLLRDFDIAVIVDRIPEEETVQRLYDRIYRALNLKNPQNKLFRFSDFVVDIKFLQKKDLIYPDIWFYDLKAASQLLYGEDIVNSILTKEADIPLSSGLRVLFEKVCGLLGNFNPNYLKAEKIPQKEKEMLVFECYKTYLEICTALCILAAKYEPKYVTRAKILEDFYYEKFPDLAQRLPDLPEKVRVYTDFKLNPNFDKVCENPIELWFSTRNALGKVLSFYLERYLSTSLSDWNDLPSEMKKASLQYYGPLLHSLIRAKFGFSNKAILNICGFLYQALMNIEYAYAVSNEMGRVYLHPLRRCYMSPSLKFFQAGILILFSLKRDGTVEEQLLKKAAKELSHCVPLKLSTFDLFGWDNLRRYFLKAYSLYRGYHFVK